MKQNTFEKKQSVTLRMNLENNCRLSYFSGIFFTSM